MGKELDTAGNVVTGNSGGGFSNIKETVYNLLANCFSWLSTHQGAALIIILCVLALVIWYVLRVRNYRKKLEEEVKSKSVEIDKKDALIGEQKNNLEALQKKMSDQQGFIREALLGTITTITGYDSDQLPVFFKFLTKINGNPLQIADAQLNAGPDVLRLEEKSVDDAAENDAEEQIGSITGPGEAGEPDKNGEK